MVNHCKEKINDCQILMEDMPLNRASHELKGLVWRCHRNLLNAINLKGKHKANSVKTRPHYGEREKGGKGGYKFNWCTTSWNNYDTWSADNGVCSAVFRMTVFPHANAGPTFQAYMRSRKFQGMICPATPIGSCNVCTWCSPSAGIVRPWTLSAQPEEFVYRKLFQVSRK